MTNKQKLELTWIGKENRPKLEPKASNQLDAPVVLAKQDAATKWCRNASEYAASYGGKPWRYVLMPHDAVAENMSLYGLAVRYDGK